MARRSVRVDGRALERLRLARGYGRQTDLAEAAGVSASTVSRAETSATEAMSVWSAKQLADALGVALEALILETDDGDDPDPIDEQADALAERIADRAADKLAERLPAIVRAVLAEQTAQAGHHGGGPRRQGLLNTDENDEALLARRPAWPVLAVAG